MGKILPLPKISTIIKPVFFEIKNIRFTFKKIDRLVLLEILVGIILFSFSLFSVFDTYQRFGFAIGYAHGETVPVKTIEEYWYTAFTQMLRAFLLSFISGLILMHGILAWIMPKGAVPLTGEVSPMGRSKFIEVVWEDFPVQLELMHKSAPKTCEMILNSLPFESKINLLGKGIRFETPIKIGPENQKLLAKPSDVGYYIPTRSICIFYEQDRLVVPVNIFAKVKGDVKIFQKMVERDKIQLRKIVG